MRVAQFVTGCERGGAQAHVLQLVRHFRQHYPIVVATGHKDWLSDELEALGVEVHLLRHLRRELGPHDVRAIREARRFMRAHDIGFAHGHTFKAGLVSRLAAASVGAESLYTAHGWNFAPALPKWRRGAAVAIQSVACRLGPTVAVSEADTQLARRYRIPCETIQNGIPDIPQRADPASSNVVLWAARFAPQKDPHTLARALRQPGPWTLRFAGGGHQEMEAEVRAITPHAEMLGMRSDVPDLLADAGVFALTTWYEGLPLAILEAMRAGLPVVATRTAGIPEAVVHGETGFLVPPGDVDAVVAALSALEDPELRGRMGQAGRARFEAMFHEDRMLEKIAAYYEAAARRRGETR